jgi:hypothetical protein
MSDKLSGWDFARTWYQGSPFVLKTLLASSTITQDRDLARVFSHKPQLVVQDFNEQGRCLLKHNGTLPGYLYEVIGVDASNVYPHPQTTMEAGQEWLTRCDFALRLIEPTKTNEFEILTPAEIASLQARSE